MGEEASPHLGKAPMRVAHSGIHGCEHGDVSRVKVQAIFSSKTMVVVHLHKSSVVRLGPASVKSMPAPFPMLKLEPCVINVFP